MNLVTRVQAVENLRRYIGQDLRVLALQHGITTFETGRQNKGWKGQVLERLAGLTTNVGQAPDGGDYELKSVSFRYTKGSLDILVPKETMAITMINAKDVAAQSFFESHCWAKLKSMIFCAVMWYGKNAEKAELLKVANIDFAEDDSLVKEIQADYDFIRNKLITQGFSALTGKDGTWIQARTKGKGGVNLRTGQRNPITRGFYAKKALVLKIFETAS